MFSSSLLVEGNSLDITAIIWNDWVVGAESKARSAPMVGVYVEMK